ncbi:MAG: hypothetical protein LW847_10425 [Burkholderiales bacterium]|jgi:hypothetical protein|nr:hypothetical protein [Burkholderiales bacterium]
MASPKSAAACLAALLAATLPALAQRSIFVCTDAAGKRITADRPPPECAGREIRELNADGSLRRVIEPPPTPEQRAARAAEETRQKEAAERQREQTRRDLALLATYSSVAQIEAARARALAGRQATIDRAQVRKQQLEAQRKKLDQEAEFYPKRDLPEKLKRAYADNDMLSQAEDRIIADTRADMQRIGEGFDADARRFREMEAAGSTGRRSTAPAQ